MKDKESKEVEDNLPFLIPSESPTVYATGAFGGFTAHDFRIFLYSESAFQKDEILPPGNINVMREIQAEVVMSPLTAKELAKWLNERVDEFEKKMGSIPAGREIVGEEKDEA